MQNRPKYKNSWRQTVNYLPRVDRAGILRRSGSVLILEKVALRGAMERKYAGQQQRKKSRLLSA